MVYSITNGVPNEVGLKRVYWGTEVKRGVAVAPTFCMYGDFKMEANRSLASNSEYNGTFMQAIDPVYGPFTAAGTYSDELFYEDLQIFLPFGLKGGLSLVSDAGTPAAYVMGPIKPDITRDTLNAFSFEDNFQGMPFAGSRGMVDSFTISADIDDQASSWKLSAVLKAKNYAPKAATAVTATGGSTTTFVKTAAGWTVDQWAGAYITMLSGLAIGDRREIVSNTATTITVINPFSGAVANTDTASISGQFTPGIANRARTPIRCEGTNVYIDPIGGTIATTPRPDRIISWSVTVQNNVADKRFMDNIDTVSNLVGRGEFAVMGEIKMEFNDLTEYNQWASMNEVKIRIAQENGAVINATPSSFLARIDILRAAWDNPTKDVMGSNIIATFPFKGFYDKTNGAAPIAFTVTSKLSALP